jgi:hypothetical protein
MFAVCSMEQQPTNRFFHKEEEDDDDGCELIKFPDSQILQKCVCVCVCVCERERERDVYVFCRNEMGVCCDFVGAMKLYLLQQICHQKVRRWRKQGC